MMSTELFLAVFLMGVGLSVAGAGTHLYQALARQQAMLRYDGHNFAATLGHLGMSFVCGPYIMLQLGWRAEDDAEAIPLSNGLIAAFVAFGWAFITGLLFVSLYIAILG